MGSVGQCGRAGVYAVGIVGVGLNKGMVKTVGGGLNKGMVKTVGGGHLCL